MKHYPYQLTSREKALVDFFRALTRDEQQAFLVEAKQFNDRQITITERAGQIIASGGVQ